MAATGIDIRKLTSISAAVLVIELIAAMVGTRLFSDSLFITGATRLCQILAIVLVFFSADGSLSAIGIRLASIERGVKRGVLWSFCFGLAAALAAVLLYATGTNPLSLIGGHSPAGLSHIVILFAVGGLIGPVAEEMFFRGVLYGFFRRWGLLPALLISTALFVLVHLLVRPLQGFMIIQAIGGVLFAVSYELEKNLMVPITIHCLGNMALFSIPMLS